MKSAEKGVRNYVFLFMSLWNEQKDFNFSTLRENRAYSKVSIYLSAYPKNEALSQIVKFHSTYI